MSMGTRGRRMLRLAAVVLLGGLAAATRPAGTTAQEPPMRWDGSLEHLSADDIYTWQGNQPAGAARMSRHPMSRDGRYVVFGADFPYSPSPTNYKTTFKRDRLTGQSEMFFGATEEPPVISADGNHFAFQSCESWLRYDQAPICDIYIMGSVVRAFRQCEHHGRRSVERRHERRPGPERRWALSGVSNALDHAAPDRNAAPASS